MARDKDEPLVYNSFEELLGILAEERRKSLKKRKNVKVILAFYGLFFCLLVLVAAVKHVNFSSFIGAFSGSTGMIAGMYAVSEKQRKGMQALTAFEDVRAVPPLITALEYNDKNIKAVAADALPGLLSRLQASDAALLTPEHHAILNRVLKNDMGIKTSIAIRLRASVLQALQQVGDVSSLPLVAELAEGKGKAAGQPEIERTAQECLPFLNLRAENQRLNHTLLRASDGNVTPVAMLLRPALGQTETTLCAAELLRVPCEDTESQAAVRPIVVHEPQFVVHEPQQAEQELHL